MPLNSPTIQPTHAPTDATANAATDAATDAPNAPNAPAHTPVSLTVTLHTARAGAQTVGLALLSNELLAHIASFLPLHAVHRLGSTSRALSYLVANAHFEDRATRVCTPAGFRALTADVRGAPTALRRRVVARLAERLSELPPPARPGCAALVRDAILALPEADGSALWAWHGDAVMSVMDMPAAVAPLRRGLDIRRLVTDAHRAPHAQRLALAHALWDHIPTLAPRETPNSCKALEHLIFEAELPRLDASWHRRVEQLADMADAASTEQLRAEQRNREEDVLAQVLAAMLSHMFDPNNQVREMMGRL